MNAPSRHATPDRTAARTLNPLAFPLHGSRLIEASAGTGKTWTIAALYVRLIIGATGTTGEGERDAEANNAADDHERPRQFRRALLPSEILVMTFTRAATRELSDRIRQRLLQAAACFRGDEDAQPDDFLRALVAGHAAPGARAQAAQCLALAAESMDEAAIFTIDAWCQRMLREHAFDSGSLFDEELAVGQQGMFDHAVHDYWRRHVYPLRADLLAEVRNVWSEMPQLHATMKQLVRHAGVLGPSSGETLAATVEAGLRAQNAILRELKRGWAARADRMEHWILAQREAQPKCFSGVKLKPATVAIWFAQLREWAASEGMLLPWAWSVKAWERLTPDGMRDACSKGHAPEIPDDFAEVEHLKTALAAIAPLAHAVLRHAALTIAQRIADLRQQAHQFGFDDLLTRLRLALEGDNGAALRNRIVAQFPVAMIDEFQDTSPDQYRIFDLLYRIADNDPQTGLFLIGDPKQAIYGFRGADIHSYLLARAATAGRHYQLATNFRSSADAVAAVNRLFLHAEGDGGHPGHARGAFGFRDGADNPLPFDAVAAHGRREQFVREGAAVPALTIWSAAEPIGNKDTYHRRFAAICADHIVASLDDADCGFRANNDARFERLRPADIAILVRDRVEAGFVRRALRRRGVASVYLSDSDSVFKGALALDVLRWLRAIASPDDTRLAHAAIATATVDLPLPELLALATDDIEWERRVQQLKRLRQTWQRQGVLAALRRLIHEFDLPARMLQATGGERRLTDLLHLSELLQAASTRLDGEHALIRWLAGQIEGEGDGDSDERTLRLESDAELVKVVTVHKSKGLEYPLVYLPFAVSFRAVTKRRAFCEFTSADGSRVIDFSLSGEGMQAMAKARLEEDLRLMYVALTRARHALWLGVADVSGGLHQSAFGYLLTGGAAEPDGWAARLQRMAATTPSIRIESLPPTDGEGNDNDDHGGDDHRGNDGDGAGNPRMLSRRNRRPALIDAPLYTAGFERDWSIASYTSITRGTVAAPTPNPATALQEKLLDHDDGDDEGHTENADDSNGDNDDEDGARRDRIAARNRYTDLLDDDAPWHRFPRGALPGQFLHDQLEWLGCEGYGCVADAGFDERLARRCERAGWGNRQQDAIAWLRVVATVRLPPLGAALSEIGAALPEMEFWFPTDRLRTRRLDALCRQHLLPGQPRAPLPERTLSGMLKGYADVIFEYGGRYWVLDYKSNALAAGDAGYHPQALAAAMAAHRYEVQGLIYMLALHRLLRSRLGADYDPARHLGGALFYFIRGVGNAETRGCYLLTPDAAMLDAADALLDNATEADGMDEAHPCAGASA